MAAEVAHEFDEFAGRGIGHGSRLGRGRRAHLALLTTEHLDLGATEAIDGLLRIAHGAQRALPRTRQVAYQIDLHLVGILKLIDHDHLKAALVRSTDGRVIAQGLVGHTQQVVIIEGGLGSLQRAILSLHGTGQAHQRIERRATAGKHDIDKRIGGLGLEQLDLLLRNALLARGMVHDIMSRAASAMVLPLASNASMASSAICAFSVAALLAPSAAR